MQRTTMQNRSLPMEHTFNFRVKVNYEEGHVSITGPNQQIPVQPTFTHAFKESNTSVGSMNNVSRVENNQQRIDCVICQKSYDMKEFENHLEIHRNRYKLSPTHSLPAPSGISTEQNPTLFNSRQQMSRISEQSSSISIFSHHTHHSPQAVFRQPSKKQPELRNAAFQQSLLSRNTSEQHPHTEILSSRISSNSSVSEPYQPIPSIPQYQPVPQYDHMKLEQHQHHQHHQHQDSFYSIQEQPAAKHTQKVHSERFSSEQQSIDSDSSSDEFTTMEKVQPLENLKREQLISIYHSKEGSKHLTEKPYDLYSCNISNMEAFSTKQVQSCQIGSQIPSGSKVKKSRVSLYSGTSSLRSSKMKLPKNYLAQNQFIQTNSSTKSRKL